MVTPNVIITPEKFKLVFGVNEDCTLELTNVGYDAIIYRLQTVAPDHYVVKHAKGVVRGNSATKIIITLNQRRIQQYEKNNAAAKTIKDDFLLEYALLGEDDVIEPRYANISQLIKDKKTENSGSVLRKLLRSHIFLDTNAAATTGPDPNGSEVEDIQVVRAPAAQPPSDTSSPAGHKVDASKDEKPSLAQREVPKEKLGGKEASVVTKDRSNASPRLNILLLLGVLTVAVVVWILME